MKVKDLKTSVCDGTFKLVLLSASSKKNSINGRMKPNVGHLKQCNKVEKVRMDGEMLGEKCVAVVSKRDFC